VSDTSKSLDTLATTSQFSPVIAVKAVSKGGAIPLVGVQLKLAIIGNWGSYVPAPDSLSTAITDSTGVARFPSYYIDKAGGYVITVRSEFGSASAINSNQFNIDGH
jgi:hypothetical protein